MMLQKSRHIAKHLQVLDKQTDNVQELSAEAKLQIAESKLYAWCDDNYITGFRRQIAESTLHTWCNAKGIAGVQHLLDRDETLVNYLAVLTELKLEKDAKNDLRILFVEVTNLELALQRELGSSKSGEDNKHKRSALQDCKVLRQQLIDATFNIVNKDEDNVKWDSTEKEVFQREFDRLIEPRRLERESSRHRELGGS